jgi:hypothetical protein
MAGPCGRSDQQIRYFVAPSPVIGPASTLALRGPWDPRGRRGQIRKSRLARRPSGSANPRIWARGRTHVSLCFRGELR